MSRTCLAHASCPGDIGVTVSPLQSTSSRSERVTPTSCEMTLVDLIGRSYRRTRCEQQRALASSQLAAIMDEEDESITDDLRDHFNCTLEILLEANRGIETVAVAAPARMDNRSFSTKNANANKTNNVQRRQ